MSIRLLEAISIAGVDNPIGTTVTGSAAWEAGLVASNKAVYVSRTMNPGEGLVHAQFATDTSGNVTGLVGPDVDIELTAFPYWPIQVSCAAGATTAANGSLLGGVGDVLGKVDYVVNTIGVTATLTVQDGTTGTTYTLHPTGGISTAGFGSIDLGYTALVGPWRVTCGAGLAAVANLL